MYYRRVYYLNCIIADPVGQDANERVPDSSCIYHAKLFNSDFWIGAHPDENVSQPDYSDRRARRRNPSSQKSERSKVVLSARRCIPPNFINYISQIPICPETTVYRIFPSVSLPLQIESVPRPTFEARLARIFQFGSVDSSSRKIKKRSRVRSMDTSQRKVFEKRILAVGRDFCRALIPRRIRIDV